MTKIGHTWNRIDDDDENGEWAL